MKKRLGTAAVVFLAVVGGAGAVDFDGAKGTSEVLELAAVPRSDNGISVRYYKNVCETLTLGSAESSGAKDLVSILYGERIEETPADQGYPVVRRVPYETGRFITKISVARKVGGLYPWEKETFSVCAFGSELQFKTVSAANQYKSAAYLTPLNADTQSAVYELRALKKLPMAPDPKGIQVGDFARRDGTFLFTASDKWASYYAGEAIRFTARVFETETIYPDAQAWDQTPTVYRRQIAQAQLELPAAAAYPLAFTLGEIAAGPERAVSVSFARIGSVSTAEEVEAALFPF